ncbi:MAG TPA: hypothetical protein VF532_18565 [Candidatus Angelobacter sp.]
MQKIRQILLNEYIGAITIGLVLAQAAGITISIIMRPINFYLERSNRPRGLFSSAEASFPWGSMIAPAMNLVLYLLVAFALLYWLYLKQPHAQPPAAQDPEPGTEKPAEGRQP